MSDKVWDVIVVGGGNAAFCAAHAAREHGASVLVLERANEEEAGGNSAFTAGAIRFAFITPRSGGSKSLPWCATRYSRSWR